MLVIETDGLVITKHAWSRFRERWEGNCPECFTTELLRLLKTAEPEDIGHGAVARILDNGFKPATYYISEGWRFVLDEECKRLLTCERPYLQKTVRNGRSRNKKRRKQQKL